MTSRKVVGEDQTGFSTATGWALLTWNAGVYFIGGNSGDVYEFDLASQKLTFLVSVGDEIVGAAAAPCFP